MKNLLPVTLLLALGFADFAFRPTEWVRFAVDSRMSVQLPAAPKETSMAPAPIQMFSFSDTAGTYVVMRAALGATFVGERRDGYYEALVKGVAAQASGEIVDRSTFVLGGYTGVEYASTGTNPKNGRPLFLCGRCLLVGKVAYVLQFIPTDASGKRSQRQRAPFFNSMTLTSAPAGNRVGPE